MDSCFFLCKCLNIKKHVLEFLKFIFPVGNMLFKFGLMKRFLSLNFDFEGVDIFFKFDLFLNMSFILLLTLSK